MFVRTLSGRILLLAGLFVLLAEVLIFVPSVARFREAYLLLRLERAQIASLALLATDEMIAPDLEAELLANAGVLNVVLRRDEMRQLVLSSPIPEPVQATFDLREASRIGLMLDGLVALLGPENRIIRVIGDPIKQAGLVIEVTMETAPMRAELRAHALRILAVSAAVSMASALLLVIAVQRLLVAPIHRVVRSMAEYAEAPEDARRVIVPQSNVIELREAEDALKMMQEQLTAALRQRERLAQLGEAVAKISHDLRNILTTSQLFADRMEASRDPAVQRAAPKLVNSIARAINLCEATLAFGKAEEPPPRLGRFMLSAIVSELVESEGPAAMGANVEFVLDVPPNLSVRADHEQVYRVLTNLVRNACQAMEGAGRGGTIEIAAGEDDAGWWIRVGDTGPGLPEKTRAHLFRAFQSGVRKGGTGLGLAIAADLVRGHGGSLSLVRSDEDGTEFLIHLPKEITQPEAAAQRDPAVAARI